MKILTVANIISAFRLVAVLYALAFLESKEQMLLVLTIAILSDIFNGFFAKLLKQETIVGKYLEAVADFIAFGVFPAYLMVNFFDLPLFLGLIIVFVNLWRESKILLAKGVDKKFRNGVPNTAISFALVVLSLAGVNNVVGFALISIILLILPFRIPLMEKRFGDILKDRN